jgi:hypothetical protein
VQLTPAELSYAIVETIIDPLAIAFDQRDIQTS